MENPELGRKVLDVHDLHPENFDMWRWGEKTQCGTVACLGGTAMRLSGYTLTANSEWKRPDGTPVNSNVHEAAKLLGLSDEEEYDCDRSLTTRRGRYIWYDLDHGPDRLRKLVEEAEGRQALLRRGIYPSGLADDRRWLA